MNPLDYCLDLLNACQDRNGGCELCTSQKECRDAWDYLCDQYSWKEMYMSDAIRFKATLDKLWRKGNKQPIAISRNTLAGI